MTDLTTAPPLSSTGTGKIPVGVVGGLVGGVVFGVLMQMVDMMPMVAMLVGSESVAVGWLVHLAVSAALGALFVIVLFVIVPGRRATALAPGLALGAAWGVVWWVLGALVLMPARLGMDLFRLDTTAMQSLMGHVLDGLVLGAVVVTLGRRAAR